MNIYQTLQIGAFHTNHCEDFLISEQITTNEYLIAVMDGCSMGTESVFASILYGKMLRNIAKKMFYQEFSTPEKYSKNERLKEVFRQLMQQARELKNQLGLSTNELLSTIVLGLVDGKQSQAEFLTIGDGLICVDGDMIEYEQDDKPDYLGYHLGEDFEKWYNLQHQRLSIDKFTDISICTDGIFTFKNLENKLSQKNEREVLEYLLVNQSYIGNSNCLDRKVRELREKEGHVVTDDLAIIRWVKES